jgi:AcrR family transcriptional regulator
MTKKKDSYHHGHLRATLLTVATEMIAEEGVEALTMRGLSRRIGVSRTAPYRHFDDKSALLAAIAEEGFNQLTQGIQPEDTDSGGNILSIFEKMWVGYVHFAIKNPTLYSLMFGKQIFNWQHYPGLLKAGAESFNQVVELVRIGQQTGKIKSGDPRKLAYVAWSMAHGLAIHTIDGRGERVGDREEVIQLAVQTLIKGLSK